LIAQSLDVQSLETLVPVSRNQVDGVKVLTLVPAQATAERKLRTRVEPEYPETLPQLRIGGSARLELTISPKGTVANVAVPGGNPVGAAAAENRAKPWIYAPWSSRTTIQVTIPCELRR
jgi:outer membrane biosynthesis protein TonB